MNNIDKKITVNLDSNLVNELEVLCSKINKTKSEILQEALKLYQDAKTIKEK